MSSELLRSKVTTLWHTALLRLSSSESCSEERRAQLEPAAGCQSHCSSAWAGRGQGQADLQLPAATPGGQEAAWALCTRG